MDACRTYSQLECLNEDKTTLERHGIVWSRPWKRCGNANRICLSVYVLVRATQNQVAQHAKYVHESFFPPLSLLHIMVICHGRVQAVVACIKKIYILVLDHGFAVAVSRSECTCNIPTRTHGQTHKSFIRNTGRV